MNLAEILKIREITIDTMQHKEFNVKEEELKLIRFYQNDLNSAKLLINVTHDKVVTDFSSATGVQIAFLKPDCKRVFQDVQNVNQMQGKYYVVLSTQTLIAYGNVIAQLRFTFPNNKVIETCMFAFIVDESIMSDDAMKSTNEFPVIQKAIEAGEKLKNVDIDGIIAAGELAKGTVKKSGDTMTGDLRIEQGKIFRFLNAAKTATVASLGVDGNGIWYAWSDVAAQGIFRYNPSSKYFNMQADTNLVKKADIYANFVQPNGRAFGINGSDLDTITSSGYYSGSNLKNAPEGMTQYFYVEVVAHGTGVHVKQEATLLNSVSFRKFYRIMNNSVWQPWVELTPNSKDGTTNLIITNDFTPTSGAVQNIVRRGNSVTLMLDVTRNADSTNPIMTTLPEGLRPIGSLTTDVASTDGTMSRLLIRFNGEIHLDTKGKRYRILQTFVTN